LGRIDLAQPEPFPARPRNPDEHYTGRPKRPLQHPVVAHDVRRWYRGRSQNDAKKREPQLLPVQSDGIAMEIASNIRR
jgi:hypothetical protein